MEGQLPVRANPREGASGGPGFHATCRAGLSDTFSPTPFPSSIPMIATAALQRDWTRNHWDIEQAFVQSRIDREIFVRLPKGRRNFFGEGGRLSKALRGLCQCLGIFHQLSIQKLLEIGLER